MKKTLLKLMMCAVLITATNISALAEIQLNKGIDGLSHVDNPASFPNDPNAAVGPNHILEIINDTYRIYKKDGTVVSTASIEDLIRQLYPDELGTVDPNVFYDDIAHRFVIEFNGYYDEEHAYLAVAKTSDPTQGFNITRATFPGAKDGSKGGFNADAYFIYATSGTAIIKKSTFTISYQTTNTYGRPARMHGATTGGPFYFTDQTGGGPLRVTRVDNVLSSSPTFTIYDVAGSSGAFDPATAMWRNNSLVAADTGADYWWQVDTSTTTPRLTQQGQVPAPRSGYVNKYGGAAIAPNGDIALTYMQCSSDSTRRDVSMWVTGRKASDPLGTMQPPVKVVSSLPITQPGGQHGDFSSIVCDVDTNGNTLNTFWACNGYVNQSGEATWLQSFWGALTAPTIATQPQSAVVVAGGPAAFHTVVQGASPSYQWRKNGVNISGATNSYYYIPYALANDAGNYSVKVSNSLGNVTSTSATLTVLSIPNGTYKIVNQASGLALDATNGGGAGTGLDQQVYSGVNQQWVVTLVGNGYKITSAANGLAASGPTDKAQLILQNYNGASSQIWTLKTNGTYFILENFRTGGQVMDDSDASPDPGNPIKLWGPPNQSTAENWTLTLISPTPGTGGWPVADAYVRNGNYATTNYGPDPLLTVKLDGNSYQRESFLKFDVSGLATAHSVQVQLVPVAVNSGSRTLAFEYVSDDSWTETGITWSNKPAGSGTVFTNISSFTVGQPILVDVTAQAKAQAAGDGLLSMRIYSTTAGSTTDLSFASKENTNLLYRPLLIVDGQQTGGQQISYVISNPSGGGYALDDPNGGGAGTGADQVVYSSVNQQWVASSVGNDEYAITNVANGLALTASNLNSQLYFQPYTGASSQLWKLIPNGTNYNIQNVGSTQNMDDNTGGLGNKVTQWSASSSNQNQQWQLTPVMGPLPSGWNNEDIGNVGLAGSSGFANGVLTMKGSGDDIWNGADAFQYAYVPVTGNFTFTARVTSQGNTDPWAKAGIMARETTDAGSKYFGVYMTPTTSHGLDVQYRSTAGNDAVDLAEVSGPTPPYWVQLVRSNNVFKAYARTDGSTWGSPVTSQTITMNSAIYVGLAVCAHNINLLCTATFDNASSSFGGQMQAQMAMVKSTSVKLTAKQQTGGQFTLQFQGQTNVNYVVEMSTNLVDWTPVYTNVLTAGDNGVFNFTNQNTNLPARFYRVAQ